MDFKDSIKQVADRVSKIKDKLETEEATKNGLIMPFMQALGYDVFNPLEVMPEFTCDIGTKKGEKIDYAILSEGKPILLIECKHWNQDLNLHDNQLLRYFHASDAKFGILTNGIIYRFYTDLETPNKMDEKPFMEFNICNIKSNVLSELKKFHKTNFNLDSILCSASDLKYTGELMTVLKKEFADPSPEFVKVLAKQVYMGVCTQRVVDEFTELTKKSINTLISEIIAERLESALKTETQQQATLATDTSAAETKLPDGVIYQSECGDIITTEEEMGAFNIVKAILYENMHDIKKVVHRDTKSYFGILYDDNNRKPICRLHLNSDTHKYISTFDENKIESKFRIESISDIYKYAKEIKTVAMAYMEDEK